MIVGTSENNIPFYVKQGFDKYYKTIKKFFVDNYNEEIWDGDLQCIDMYYYSNHLNSTFIKNIICKVKPINSNENNALYFWQKIIKMKIFDEYEDSIFVRNSICMANNKIDDLKKLKHYLKHNKLNFAALF